VTAPREGSRNFDNNPSGSSKPLLQEGGGRVESDEGRGGLSRSGKCQEVKGFQVFCDEKKLQVMAANLKLLVYEALSY
jgi:hypothetical protein